MVTAAHLRLDTFFVEDLYIATNRGIKNAAEARTDSVQVGVEEAPRTVGEDESVAFATRIRVDVNGDDASFKHARYQITASFYGMFTLLPGLPEQQADFLIRYNAPSILWGIARGLLAEHTGNFPWGRLILPAVNFIDTLKAGPPEQKPLEAKPRTVRKKRKKKKKKALRRTPR